METITPPPVDIPTALPGFEDDQLREKLLLEAIDKDPNGEADEDEMDPGSDLPRPKPRRWKVIRTLAAFAAFVCILGIAISWFFGMGWFAEQKAQPISRNTAKDGQTSPATEDEKLKLALSMVAAPATSGTPELNRPSVLDGNDQNEANLDLKTDDALISPAAGDQGKGALTNAKESYSLRRPGEDSTDNTQTNISKTAGVASALAAGDSDDVRGRSLFFGLSKKPVREEEPLKREIAQPAKAEQPGPVPSAQIPFGTLLPVRLVGSIYTLRNSGGFVRMEITRPVEGKGYSYPAGTMIVGSVRGGESVRAFVNIVGLIDPTSGELVRFSGELLGRDGGSGIEGRRRNLTSQWARFFRGMKDTAASVLGSVGAIRSANTVVLSEPIRKGTESMTADLSGSTLSNEREDTFLEVAAGASGYVLVAGLPENSAAATNKPAREAAKE
jgi:hypothetical protein